MPDIDPAALSRSDSIAPSIPNPLNLSKINSTSLPTSTKAQKPNHAAQRIDLEPLYTSLKAAVGDNWKKYTDAVGLFLIGRLNQNELSLQIDHFLGLDPNTEHLHNQFIAAIYGNVVRDVPDQGVAPWVSANDKPTLLSKPLGGDEAEQRLKREIMQLPARDRRRIKEVADRDQSNPQTPSLPAQGDKSRQVPTLPFRPIHLFNFIRLTSLTVLLQDWDLEIKKRYLPALSSETFEFPSPQDLHLRMVPICYEESLTNGCNADCAEFMANALEHYMKSVISNIVGRVRSDLPGINSVCGGVITTSAHANAIIRGAKQKKESTDARKALGVSDMRVAASVGGWGELAQMPTVVMGFMNGWNEGVLEGWVDGDDEDEEQIPEDEMERGGNRPGRRPVVDGYTNGLDGYVDEGDDEDQNWGWAGGGATDRRQLGALLDECLAIGS
ncbi:MAG: hypothetical protein LQ344_005058 [Seirophora lacunosa]|nr:MAG: hypothetical protein LQ344_005058 [Seirophora lacunosa]